MACCCCWALPQSFVGGWHLMAKPTRPRRLVEVIFFFQLASCCFLGCLFWLLAEFTKFLHQLCDEAASIVKHKLQSFVFLFFFWFHFWLAGCFQTQVHKSLHFFGVLKGFFLMEPPTFSSPGATTKPKRNGVRPKRVRWTTPRRSSHGCRCCHLSLSIGFLAMGLKLGPPPPRKKQQKTYDRPSSCLQIPEIMSWKLLLPSCGRKLQHVWKMFVSTQWETYLLSLEKSWSEQHDMSLGFSKKILLDLMGLSSFSLFAKVDSCWMISGLRDFMTLAWPYTKDTPPKINIEPENDEMIFLFHGCVLRFHVKMSAVYSSIYKNMLPNAFDSAWWIKTV